MSCRTNASRFALAAEPARHAHRVGEHGFVLRLGAQVGLDPNGHAQGMTGPVAYWHVEDIAATVQTLVAAGATVQQPAKDYGGKLVGTLIDNDGNPIGLVQQVEQG